MTTKMKVLINNCNTRSLDGNKLRKKNIITLLKEIFFWIP